MIELLENATREETKQYIAGEIANVRKTIDAEMENIRKIQGAETSSLDRNKIYFFDKDGKEISGNDNANTTHKHGYNYLTSIPQGTAKIVTAGSLLFSEPRLDGQEPDTRLKGKIIIAGGDIKLSGTGYAELISGGSIDAKEEYLLNNVSALGKIEAHRLGDYRSNSTTSRKIIAGTDVTFQETGNVRVNIISGHDVFQQNPERHNSIFNVFTANNAHIDYLPENSTISADIIFTTKATEKHIQPKHGVITTLTPEEFAKTAISIPSTEVENSAFFKSNRPNKETNSATPTI